MSDPAPVTAIPEQVVREAFEAWIDQVDPSRLIDLVPIGRPAKVVRSDAKQRFSHKLTNFNRELFECLGESFPMSRLVRALTREQAQDLCAPLMVACGRGETLLAYLQDERPGVQARAKAWLEGRAPEPFPDEDAAAKTLKKIFGPLMGKGGGSASTDRLTRENKAFKERIETLERDLKEARRALTEAKEKAEQAAKKSAQDHAQELRERDKRLEALAKAVEDAAKRLDERAEAEAQRRLDNALDGWLRPRLQAEELLQGMAKEGADLFTRAKAAIAAQQVADRPAEQHAKLRAELNQVELQLNEVDAVLRQAHNKLPALRQVRRELAERGIALRNALRAQDETLGDFAAMLRDAFMAAEAAPPETFEPLLSLARRLDLIGKPEEAALRTQLAHLDAARKHDLFDDTLSAAKPVDPLAAEEPFARRNPVLAAALRGEAELHLYLDGHNLLNCMARYQGPNEGRHDNHEAAREMLERDVEVLAAHLPRLYVVLVWDGEERTDHNLGRNAIVHYSGGRGEHRADNYILNEMGYHARKSPLALISNDRDFRSQAAEFGAECCYTNAFEPIFVHLLSHV